MVYSNTRNVLRQHSAPAQIRVRSSGTDLRDSSRTPGGNSAGHGGARARAQSRVHGNRDQNPRAGSWAGAQNSGQKYPVE